MSYDGSRWRDVGERSRRKRWKDRSNNQRAEDILAACERAAVNPADYDALAPYLASRSCDPALLRWVYGRFVAEGYTNRAPGPDGIRLPDLSLSQWCDEFRQVARAFQAGDRTPPQYRPATTAKSGGKKRRRVMIADWSVRIQQRALAEMTSRLVDPQFAWFNVGFRPQRGTHFALAVARRLVESEARWFARSEDIQAAFDRVAHFRLREALGAFRDETFIDRLMLMSCAPAGLGIAPGSPLSPIILNIDLHQYLDRPFAMAQLPALHLRYADDLLFFGESREHVNAAKEFASGLLDSVGMRSRAKNAPKKTVDLRKQAVGSLGFRLRVDDGRLRFLVPPDAFARLRIKLGETRRVGSDASLRALRVLRQWIAAYGPGWEDVASSQLLGDTRRALRACGFCELFDEEEIAIRWSEARHDWNALCGRIGNVRESGRPMRLSLGTQTSRRRRSAG